MERQEQAKLAAENLAEKFSAEIGRIGGGIEARDEAPKPAQPHPREILLRDLRDHEERLIDKLVAIRELRNQYQFLSRDEAERVHVLSSEKQFLEISSDAASGGLEKEQAERVLKMGRLAEQLLR